MNRPADDGPNNNDRKQSIRMNAATHNDSLLAVEFKEAISRELEDAIRKIRHCAEQLSDDQLWSRPAESMNSIANLILHLCGNVKQWVIAGVGGSPDQRNRPQEFALRDRIPLDHLLDMLDQLATEVRQSLQNVTGDELMRRRTIQGYDVSGVQALVDSIAHFRGHAQEITHMTRMQLGESYQFDFIPGANQQGGAAT